MSGWSDAGFSHFVQQPPFTNSKNPETAFHKRQFRDFQFRPITRKQVKNDTIYLDI